MKVRININNAVKTGGMGLAAALCVVLAGSAAADTHFVATNGLNIASYTNWADAATDIQTAVDVRFPPFFGQ